MRDQILAIFQRHLPHKLKPSGSENYTTICPFHKGGQEKTASFSVNVEKAVYHCFTCHRAGPLKQLLRELKVPRGQIDSELSGVVHILQRNQENAKLKKQYAFENKNPFLADPILAEAVLGYFDFEPTSLIEDGFDPQLLKELDIGFDPQSKRITYPLRDLYGNLAGISGGAIEKGVQPKYKVYQGGVFKNQRFVDGDFGASFDEQYPRYTCENHDFLWNYDRVYPRIIKSTDPDSKVIVVEGFKACLWMQMAGFWNTVALMGSYISENQQRLLHRIGCPVVLFLDNDPAGRSGNLNVGELLWRPLRSKVRVVQYPEPDVAASLADPENLENTKTQPDDYELGAVKEFVNRSVTYTEYYNNMRRRMQTCR